MNVELSRQVVDFVARQAPDGRKMLRRALRGLELERGDIRPLEDRLAGYCRLRVGSYRVILRYVSEPGGVVLRCEFAERRSIVYEAYEKLSGIISG